MKLETKLLETLEIRPNGNPLMDDTVIEALCTALREMPWLRTLRLEMDDSQCTADGLEHLFHTIADRLGHLAKLYVQARGCDAMAADTVRRAMEIHFEQTNVAATVVLAEGHQETLLAF